MTEQYHYTSNDIARIIEEARWHIDSKQTNAGDHLIAIIHQLQTVIEAQAARIGALEAENARLRQQQTVIMRVSEDKPGDNWNEDGFLKNGGFGSGIVPYNRPSEGK